ncbi:MAG TPA: hypothetical protein LFV92_07350 [Rickettsia endosymbiont of Ceroptres masudai]|nr:hypothetical protein [Rickettsia endosymbiont of Ceroptres masudai]
MLYVSHYVIASGHCCMNRFMSFPRGPAFPSLREELRSNSTKQGRKKILIYRIFLLFFLDCSKLCSSQ